MVLHTFNYFNVIQYCKDQSSLEFTVSSSIYLTIWCVVLYEATMPDGIYRLRRLRATGAAAKSGEKFVRTRLLVFVSLK